MMEGMAEPAFQDLTLAIVDVETTGGSALHDRIIELGIQRVERGRLTATYSTFVNPERRIPPMISQLTGITDADVEDAPTFSRIRRDVRQLLDGTVFVAHNARFDYGFVRGEFERLEEPFSARCLCTVRLSRLLYPRFRHHSLSHLIERFGFACERRHRALDDAQVVWAFLRHAREQLGEARVDAAVARLLQRPTIPPHLPPDVVDRIPARPGVYVFYDEVGLPLYVGKSVDLHQRVLDHFANDVRSAASMRLCQRAARIDTRPTAGDLGARLLESHLIRMLAPAYNRAAAVRKGLTVLRAGPAADGYQTVSLGTIEQVEPGEEADVLSVWRSKAQAKKALHDIAAAHKLCLKRLGLERTRSRSCAARAVALCGGACTGEEPAALHNARLAMAFAGRRVKPWPYAGPVAIEERAIGGAGGEVFVADRWRLIKALSVTAAGAVPLFEPAPGFDVELYRILDAALSQPGRRIRPVDADEIERLAEMGGWDDGRLPVHAAV